MIRGYIEHTLRNFYLLLKLSFRKIELDSLCAIRYKVISELGEDQLKDILKRKVKSGYWEAVRGNHLEFFKHYYDIK